MNEFKLVLVESKGKDECIDCIFHFEDICNEPKELKCIDNNLNCDKTYHWELKKNKKLIMKEHKIVLVESNIKRAKCIDCIFSCDCNCIEPLEIDCDANNPDKNKKYHWELEEIKSETT